MNTNWHFVDFAGYCKKCAYFEQLGTDEPCNECLMTPARENSSKPMNWKEKTDDGRS